MPVAFYSSYYMFCSHQTVACTAQGIALRTANVSTSFVQPCELVPMTQPNETTEGEFNPIYSVRPSLPLA
jgi:hypothetical protein